MGQPVLFAVQGVVCDLYSSVYIVMVHCMSGSERRARPCLRTRDGLRCQYDVEHRPEIATAETTDQVESLLSRRRPRLYP